MKYISKISIVFVLLALVLGSLPVQPAMAATITVTSTADTDTPGTLRYAVNNAASSDTIEFDLTYPATIVLIGNIEIANNLIISGPGQENLTIDANSVGNVFNISTTENVTITDLTISNGSATDGGAIYKSQTSGALYLTRITFSSNSATNDGGAVYSVGPVIIAESSFSDNTAGGDGGAIMAFDRASLTVSTSTFFTNIATGNGGGIYYDAKTFAVLQSTFDNNQAVDGGAIYKAYANTATLTNSTFYANTASNNGGAVFNTERSISLRNNTLSTNSAASGGGIYSDYRFKMYNNIIANSTSGNDCTNYGANLIASSNLIETGNCSGDITDDPMLVTLQNNGGLTETMALLTGSPAIDAGDNTICAVPPVSNLDQRGGIRPTDGDRDNTETCDLGAFEAEDPRDIPTISVTNSPATYTGSPQAAAITGSTAGTISNVQYDGSATEPSAIGTYAVTADFIPDDTYNYQSLTEASAGDFVIDPEAVPPSVVTFTAASPASSFTISITAFTASDNVAVTGCMITESSTAPAFDDAGWAGSAPLTYTVTADGAYTLYPWAKDASGNVSGVFGSPASVTVDTTPPGVSGVVLTDGNPTNASSIDFTVTFSESVTGVDTADFSLNTTGAVAGESITGLSGSGDSYTVTVDTGTGDGTIRLDVLDDDTIIDVVSLPLDGGLTSGEVYVIDKTAPDTNIDVQPDDPSAETSPSFEFSSLDGTAVFECQLNSGGFGACTSPDVLSGLGDGEHTFEVRAVVDLAGNADATPASYTWTIETGGILFWDDFETGDFSLWSRFNDGGGYLHPCTKGAINGIWGACVDRGTDKRKQLIDETPVYQTDFAVRFNIDMNSLNFGEGERFRFMQVKMGAERPFFIVVKYEAGQYLMQLNTLLDDLTKVKTGWYLLSNAPRTIEVNWQAASADGANDGWIEFYLEDTLLETLSGLDNDTIFVDTFKIGFTSRLDGKSLSGIFYLDDIYTSNGGYIGLP